LCALDETRAADACRRLHGLRGTISNLALMRSAATLKELETQWLTLSAEQRAERLAAAEVEMTEGLAALRVRYPSLN
jgi:hypothetical protein